MSVEPRYIGNDTYFEIGYTHTNCQDYALSGHSSDGNLNFNIVSDGCSSSKYSEVGAQLLCHVTKQCILDLYHKIPFEMISSYWLEREISVSVYRKINEIRILQGLPHEALDATLMINLLYDNGSETTTYTYVWGDGVYIEKIDNKLNVTIIEYESGAPFYLSYTDQNRMYAYVNKFGNSKKTVTLITEDGISKSERKLYEPYRQCCSLSDYEIEPKAIAIASDGLTSFRNEDGSPVDVYEVAKDIMGYKRIKGEFLKSNMTFMKRKYQKENISHYDDVSVGVLVREK